LRKKDLEEAIQLFADQNMQDLEEKMNELPSEMSEVSQMLSDIDF
jgi:hypothetical protein